MKTKEKKQIKCKYKKGGGDLKGNNNYICYCLSNSITQWDMLKKGVGGYCLNQSCSKWVLLITTMNQINFITREQQKKRIPTTNITDYRYGR